MDLVVFDLDGTLLDGTSRVSDDTAQMLRQLRERGIAYTVATGRTLHSAANLLSGHGFALPQIYKNGVMIWQPDNAHCSACNLLTHAEIHDVVAAMMERAVCPFIFTLQPNNRHVVYHYPLGTSAERRLAELFATENGMHVLPVEQMPARADITNISALGPAVVIDSVEALVRSHAHLVAYAGTAIEGQGLRWLDIHHSAASKGAAVRQLKQDLGASRIICFGDGDNDLSMFAAADESYAPSNANSAVRTAATAVIGHHAEDGVAQFLRQRYDL